VLIGGAGKSVALRELFGLRKTRRSTIKRSIGEVYLHLDLSRIFYERPVLIAEGGLPLKTLRGKISFDKCYEITKRAIRSLNEDSKRIAEAMYFKFLF
jgi:hypothetical protein